jgi:hypothetical protein
MGEPARDPLPDAFRAPRLLRWLNVAAVGSALASATGVVLGAIFDRGLELGSVGLVSCATTLVFGVLWARIVRVRFGKFPAGWVAAVPLAASNAGVAFALALAIEKAGSSGSSLVEVLSLGFVLGASVGIFAWGPALLVTLVLFGLPLYHAQRAADRGLGSEDRGERVVAIMSAVMSALALVGALASKAATPALAANVATGLAGLGAGIAAAVYATRRERRRRAFVEKVEAGAAEGYRIDTQLDGPALLVRVAAEQGGYYRAPRLAEPIVELDEQGEAKRSLERRA